MKWVEVIVLRSIINDRELLASKLQKLINDVEKGRQKQALKAYSRVLIDTDFCIHITHDASEVEYRGSQLGLRLVSALKAFGLVNHSIWSDMREAT